MLRQPGTRLRIGGKKRKKSAWPKKKIGERSEQRGSQERGTWWRKLMFRKIRVKGALIS